MDGHHWENSGSAGNRLCGFERDTSASAVQTNWRWRRLHFLLDRQALMAIKASWCWLCSAHVSAKPSNQPSKGNQGAADDHADSATIYSDNAKEEFYKIIFRKFSPILSGDKIMILKAFNAWVGRSVAAWEGVLGHHGVGAEKAKMMLLLSFCAAHGLVITRQDKTRQFGCTLASAIRISWIMPLCSCRDGGMFKWPGLFFLQPPSLIHCLVEVKTLLHDFTESKYELHKSTTARHQKAKN